MPIFIVSTPIGNLGDITLRALETLKAADVIVCEDTRHTRILLDHYAINKPLISFHQHNEDATLGRLRGLYESGKTVALVTDAGSPAISDPGFTLVRMALAEGMEIVAIPGPSAFLPALVLSGLAVHSFVFRGFPPDKSTARTRFFAKDRALPYTLVYYISRYKLLASLQDALTTFGERQCAVANELTKKFEKFWRGPLSAVLQELRTAKILGEYTVVIEGNAPMRAGEKESEEPPAGNDRQATTQ